MAGHILQQTVTGLMAVMIVGLEREADDQTGAEHVLDAGFTEISIRHDWATVFEV